MFITKRKLREENERLKKRLSDCNNFRKEDYSPALNYYCALCEHSVIPDKEMPFVVLGCKKVDSCSNFTPNELYHELYDNQGSDSGDKPN